MLVSQAWFGAGYQISLASHHIRGGRGDKPITDREHITTSNARLHTWPQLLVIHSQGRSIKKRRLFNVSEQMINTNTANPSFSIN